MIKFFFYRRLHWWCDGQYASIVDRGAESCSGENKDYYIGTVEFVYNEQACSEIRLITK